VWLVCGHGPAWTAADLLVGREDSEVIVQVGDAVRGRVESPGVFAVALGALGSRRGLPCGVVTCWGCC
jgi:hypothetical protein